MGKVQQQICRRFCAPDGGVASGFHGVRATHRPQARTDLTDLGAPPYSCIYIVDSHVPGECPAISSARLGLLGSRLMVTTQRGTKPGAPALANALTARSLLAPAALPIPPQ